MSRYTVDLAHLARFIGKLDEFSTHSEEVGAAIDRQIAELHENWSGMADAVQLNVAMLRS